jgi:hypothetical protein
MTYSKHPIERILILAKTYPSPSAKYIETSCVAGINSRGMMRRLFPIPFRMIEQGAQFKKWQWIDVRIEKASNDHRPESHKVFVDTIDCHDVIPTNHAWSDRREWLDKAPLFHRYADLQQTCTNDGLSLALLRPKKITRLEIRPVKDPDWTQEERNKLLQQQAQGRNLRKIPYNFYYWYKCDTPEGEKEYRNKIVDWEVGALFWNCKKSHKEAWEIPFRQKLEGLLKSDMHFLMGNQHRFQDQWLIISLIYPPKQTMIEKPQLSLLF